MHIHQQLIATNAPTLGMQGKQLVAHTLPRLLLSHTKDAYWCYNEGIGGHLQLVAYNRRIQGHRVRHLAAERQMKAVCQSAPLA